MRRVYDPNDGGYRVLVDRLWPRGISRARAVLDEWLKDVAPSVELRQWYGHAVERYDEFARRYRAELRRSPAAEAVTHLVERARAEPVTLVTATRDVEHSGAQVLLEHLQRRLRRPAGSR